MQTEETKDGQTDINKLIVAFPSFVNAPKNQAHAHAKHEEHQHMMDVSYACNLHALYMQELSFQWYEISYATLYNVVRINNYKHGARNE